MFAAPLKFSAVFSRISSLDWKPSTTKKNHYVVLVNLIMWHASTILLLWFSQRLLHGVFGTFCEKETFCPKILYRKR